MKAARRTGGSGFTLIEMLVVITIITILAALLVPTVYTVLTRGEETAIGIEVGGLAQAMESFKSEFGEYPPDFSNPNYSNSSSEENLYLSRMFPRRVSSRDRLPAGLNPANALSFWLGGFSSDPARPITGDGDRQPRFNFDSTRFSATGTGTFAPVVITNSNGNEVRTVYAYHPAKKALPYIYLHWKTYANAAVATSANGTARAYRFATAADINKSASQLPFIEQRKFQIISAGLDDHYGVGGLKYPTGPYSLTTDESYDRDNITSFSGGKTLESQQPGQ